MLVYRTAEQPPYGTQSGTLPIDSVKEGVDTADSNNKQGTVILIVFFTLLVCLVQVYFIATTESLSQ
jgi:hypothetical protein